MSGRRVGIIFFARNFSGSFLELGIGPEQVNVGRAEIQQFIPEVHFGRLVGAAAWLARPPYAAWCG